MRKIRIGKDISLRWTILTNGEGVPLEGRDLRLVMTDPLKRQSSVDFSTEDNVIISRFPGVKQKSLGRYTLTLWENFGQPNQTAVDACNAFELVPSTCQECGATEGLDIETVDLGFSDISVGVKGASAYEIAVSNGFVGSEEEWLASLKGEKGDAFTYGDLTPEQIKNLQKPALDAAKLAEDAAKLAEQEANNAKGAAGSANTAAELANRVAGSVTELEKTVSVAETQRAEAERIRLSNETTRQQEEQSRSKAEQSRVLAEQSRVSAETARQQAEQQRVTEFSELKQESENATENANTAAQSANTAAKNANDKVAELAQFENRLSETYTNFAAIEASGETDTNKIYIDAETNTSYRWNGSEYVSIGGGSYENAQSLIFINNAGKNTTDVAITSDEKDYLNTLESISILFVGRNTIYVTYALKAYLRLFTTPNSNGLYAYSVDGQGFCNVFSKDLITAETDFKPKLEKYKELISINRIDGRCVLFSETGEVINTELDRFKQPDFVGNNNYIGLYSGNHTFSIYNYVLFNFDVNRILRFNSTLYDYLRRCTGAIDVPLNFRYADGFTPQTRFIEKYVPSNWNTRWDEPTVDSEGYTILSTSTENVSTRFSPQYHYLNDYFSKRACGLEIIMEVLEGSIKISDLEKNSEVYDIINIDTLQSKTKDEELTKGIWKIRIDAFQKIDVGGGIKSVQVPVRVKCISYKMIPYAAILQLSCDRFYNEKKVYDNISKITRDVTNGTITKDTTSFNVGRYDTKAPPANDPPKFIGEKYYNLTTGDIYEAGNLTTFKKLNDA